MSTSWSCSNHNKEKEGCVQVKCIVSALIEISNQYKCKKLRENIALVAVQIDSDFDNIFLWRGVPYETLEHHINGPVSQM